MLPMFGRFPVSASKGVLPDPELKHRFLMYAEAKTAKGQSCFDRIAPSNKNRSLGGHVLTGKCLCDC